MAPAAPPTANITIDIAAKNDFVEARDLESVLKETLDSLNGLVRNASPSHKARSKWKVTAASLKSPIQLTLTEETRNDSSDFGSTAVRALITGLAVLNSADHPTEPPPLFDSHTLRAVQRLVSVLSRDVGAIKLSSDGLEVSPSHRVSINVEELIGTKFKAFGALEGRLEALSSKGKLHFIVFDPVTRDRISCIFSPDLLEEAKAAFPQRRVAVYGEIRYDKKGKPLSIEVKRIRILKAQGELPQPTDIAGTDISGGTESSEYIRRLRDGG
jgi:hypothetical protein